MRRDGWLLLAGLLVVALMPSGDSFWGDEAASGLYAQLPDWEGFRDRLLTDFRSEAQMPLFILQTWWVGFVFGTTEWVLRAPNILWGFVALVCMYRVMRGEGAGWSAALLLVHPYVWYYVGEARPYAMQLAGGGLMLMAMHQCAQRRGSGAGWAWWMGAGALLTCGASMLGVLTVMATGMVLAGQFLVWKRWPSRGAWLGGGVAVLLLAGLGVYYARTLARGAGGARVWDLGLANVAYSFFEFSGASGLAPCRQAIRDLAKAGEWGQLLRTAGPGGVLFGGGFLCLAAYWVRSGRWSVFPGRCLAVCCGGFGLLLLLAVVVRWPFWGRHLAPVFPFFLAWAGLELNRWLVETGAGRWRHWVAAFFGVALLASSLALRFSQAHGRENHRAAAAFAQERLREGDVVWWAAVRSGALFYGLKDEDYDGRLITRLNEMPSLERLPVPDWIVLCRPDVADSGGRVRTFIQERGYREARRLTSIVIYQKPGVGTEL